MTAADVTPIRTPDAVAMLAHVTHLFAHHREVSDGKIELAQRDFQSLCIVNGIPHSVTYGRDEPIEILKHWKIVK